MFDHLTQRWKDLFNAKFDVLLHDLTSTYFESAPPIAQGDKRSDGVQAVIALIVTPEGFPLAQLKWELPPQSPPRITPKGELLQP